MTNKVLILLADGFEELEFVAPFDILSRGNVAVVTASIHETTAVESARRLQVTADLLLADVCVSDYTMLILPGGGVGTQNLCKNGAVLQLVREFNSQGKIIGAICAAPMVLAAAGVIQNSKVTSFPSTEPDVAPYCKTYSHDQVVVDGKMITSRAAGTAAAFGFALLAQLEGDDRANEARLQMLF